LPGRLPATCCRRAPNCRRSGNWLFLLASAAPPCGGNSGKEAQKY